MCEAMSTRYRGAIWRTENVERRPETRSGEHQKELLERNGTEANAMNDRNQRNTAQLKLLAKPGNILCPASSFYPFSPQGQRSRVRMDGRAPHTVNSTPTCNCEQWLYSLCVYVGAAGSPRRVGRINTRFCQPVKLEWLNNDKNRLRIAEGKMQSIPVSDNLHLIKRSFGLRSNARERIHSSFYHSRYARHKAP